MDLLTDLKKVINAQRLAKVIERQGPIELTVTDNLFPEPVRESIQSPLISLAEMRSQTGVVPLVTRGGAPIPIDGDKITSDYLEPLPVYVQSKIDPVDLNNLKLMNMGEKGKWADRKIRRLRITVKKTIEALAAQAVFSGKISHPLRLQNAGWETFEVTYLGQSIHTVTVAATKKWDHADCTPVVVYELLGEMSSTVNKAGYSGQKLYYAGKTAFSTLLALVDSKAEKSKITVQLKENAIVIGGIEIRKMDEVYINPQTGAEVAKVPDKEIRCVAKGYTWLPYASLDSLRANLKAMPMFVDVVEVNMPEGLYVTAMSKPLPAIPPEAVAKAIVVS